MSDLREQWLRPPYVIELRGGPANGRQLPVAQLPHGWRVPVMAPPTVMPREDGPGTPELEAVDYWPTGCTTYAGVHIYEARGSNGNEEP